MYNWITSGDNVVEQIDVTEIYTCTSRLHGRDSTIATSKRFCDWKLLYDVGILI